MKTASVITALCLSSAANAFQHHGRSPLKCKKRASAREMKSSTWIESEEGSGSGTGRRFEPASQQQPYNYNDRAHMTSLYLSTLEGVPDSAERASMLPQLNIPNIGSDNIDAITKVLSASLLITGNTVGSSMFVLPDAVAGLGMVWGSSLFFGECAAICSLFSVLISYSVSNAKCPSFHRPIHLQPNFWPSLGRSSYQPSRVIRL